MRFFFQNSYKGWPQFKLSQKKKQQINKKQHHNGVCPQQIKNFYGKRKATAIWSKKKKKTTKTPVLNIFLFNTSQGT